MILIKITKENREPEVGERTWVDDEGNLKALSLSVIIDAFLDEGLKTTSYPISNSEEIFQWLHDQGKLGEEWVEWEGDHLFDWDDAVILRSTDKCTCPAPLIRGVNPEYCGICEKDLESEKDKFISKVSKINETGEDEFKAEFNSPELIWEAVKELIRRYNRAFKI